MKTIEIHEEMAAHLEEIRARRRELAALEGGADPFSGTGFDMNNDQHLVESLVGTTARMLRQLVEVSRV